LPFEELFVPPQIAGATGDDAWVQAMVDFEVALGRAQGLDLSAPAVSPAELARAGRSTGNPAAALVSGWDEEGVHRGATSQDVMDTAAMLVARRTLPLIGAELDSVAAACARLAAEHRDTPMAARTLLQQALPTTFGLKAAGWLMGIDEARDLLDAVPLRVQLGGAAGTLAALGADGLAVLARLAAELELEEPVLPWHTRRVRVAQLGAALAIAAGSLEKIALDLKLMAQTEVGEVAESADGGRGGSSTLPHKRNPVGAALTIACAAGVRGASSVLTGALAQEHERAAGAWQAEWEALSRALALTGGAAASLREALDGLEVFPERMRANLDLTGGLIMGEAKRVTGKDVVEPTDYLGSAGAFVDRALQAHEERR
jgi:3-carboxy-cis,cis-muconate cycloisomerase